MLTAFLHSLISALPVDEHLDSLKVICGTRWSSKNASRSRSHRELKTALLTSCHHGLKMVFLVDGLDECSVDDHGALMRIIKKLNGYRNVKMLVSSRPWRVFAKELGHSPHLRLEELTFFEMCRYVQGELNEAESLQQSNHHFRDEDEEALSLIATIARRAEGVFLWVALVTRALTSEVRKSRSIASLYNVLGDCPDGLEQYFFERVLRTKRNKIDTANSLKLLVLVTHHQLDWLK